MNDKLTWCKVKLPEEGQLREYLFLCMPTKASVPRGAVRGNLGSQLRSALLSSCTRCFITCIWLSICWNRSLARFLALRAFLAPARISALSETTMSTVQPDTAIASELGVVLLLLLSGLHEHCRVVPRRQVAPAVDSSGSASGNGVGYAVGTAGCVGATAGRRGRPRLLRYTHRDTPLAR